jgi:hypothetical protein
VNGECVCVFAAHLRAKVGSVSSSSPAVIFWLLTLAACLSAQSERLYLHSCTGCVIRSLRCT